MDLGFSRIIGRKIKATTLKKKQVNEKKKLLYTSVTSKTIFNGRRRFVKNSKICSEFILSTSRVFTRRKIERVKIFSFAKSVNRWETTTSFCP